MVKSETYNLASELADRIVRSKKEMKTPQDLEGDFVEIFPIIDAIVSREIEGRGLSEPEVSGEVFGTYKYIRSLRSTTSTVGIILRDGKELVVKVLREPNNRHPDKKSSGAIWDDYRGHNLFAWSGSERIVTDIETGIKIQEDCLRGELKRGVLFNPKNSPYLGIVGARQTADSNIEILPEEAISHTDLVFPALLMKRADTSFLTSHVLLEWVNDFGRREDIKFWPELDKQDIARLLARSVLAFDTGSVTVSRLLKERYGTHKFFDRCLTKETPLLAASMGEWYPDSPKIVEASSYAADMLKIMEKVIKQRPDIFQAEGDTLMVAHADSKPSNSIIAAKSRDEVVKMAKGEIDANFILLDAQSLAVLPGIMYESEGVDYAHWPIVPRTQQWAYGLKMVLGMGLHEVHDRAVEEVFNSTGVEMNKDSLAAYYIWSAYKMGGVEPFVNVDNFITIDRLHPSQQQHVKLIMEQYPVKALKLLEELGDVIYHR